MSFRTRDIVLRSVICLWLLPNFSQGSNTRLAAAEKPQPKDQVILSKLDVAKELEVSLFASEPMMSNPSNIDIDHLGRVWVCEVINYRHFRNSDSPERKAGDRILVLEDTNGDGKADKTTTFYQGREIDSAHGVCVLGNTVYVSAGDSVFLFHDDDHDLKADRKEVLFTGISGVQHDHGIHAVTFGPDGKLYFNFGNAGKQIKDKHGKPIVDQAGNVVNDQRKPYQQGMVFRCNPDGTEFETLGWNFRNNWELAVDSFGNIWQSDNDDDGNRGVRINYVMEFGNYGYKDELTGAGWRQARTGMHEDIPLRHWHLRDPGVIPNLLQTGAGSPTGICVYEGRLLPEAYHGNLLHCDAGPNIVRLYKTEAAGAGFKATSHPFLDGSRDKWFRPTDVCVAPDGSVFVADWYDPGVGGHRMGDIDAGRIFRIAPAKTPYQFSQPDFDSIQGAVTALQSPNVSTRNLAQLALREHFGWEAGNELMKLFTKAKNPRMRARAYWVLGSLKVTNPDQRTAAAKIHEMAMQDQNENIRIVAIRQSKCIDCGFNAKAIPQWIKTMKSTAATNRELAIGLHALYSPAALKNATEAAAYAKAWTALANAYDGADRWYLEALGIAARGRWDICLQEWIRQNGSSFQSKAARDIVWRSRGEQTPGFLAQIITDNDIPASALPRYFRAFDFQRGPDKNKVLSQLAFNTSGNDDRARLIMAEAVTRVQPFSIGDKPEYKEPLARILDQSAGSAQFIYLVDTFKVSDRYPQVLEMAQQHPQDQLGAEAIRLLLDEQQHPIIRQAIRKDNKLALNTTKVLGTSGSGRARGILIDIYQNEDNPTELRQQAIRSLGKIRNGAVSLVALTRQDKIPTEFKQTVAATLHTTQWEDIRKQAMQLYPPPATKNNEPLPLLSELVKRKGNVPLGKKIFETTGTCAKCHQVNTMGKEVGPNLSEIGKKLSKPALYETILFPSAAISHNYETYTLLSVDGNVVSGIMVSQTDDSVSLKGADAIVRTFKRDEIEELVKQKVSLMPADLQKVMTTNDLINVVEYLTTLKRATTPVSGK